MNFALMPLVTPSFNWTWFQTVISSALGRNVTRSMDEKNVSERRVAEAIVALAEFQERNADYWHTLQQPGSLLHHFFYSFLAKCDREEMVVEVMTETDLRILPCRDDMTLYVVSGTLAQWRTTIINFASMRATRLQRTFADEALTQFDRQGLSRLWENYTRCKAGPTGILLTEKK